MLIKLLGEKQAYSNAWEKIGDYILWLFSPLNDGWEVRSKEI